MTSISSGSLFVLVLVAFFQLDSRKLVGTDLAQTLCNILSIHKTRLAKS
jgi:hypothetical protein